jgi:hypothetical protein
MVGEQCFIEDLVSGDKLPFLVWRGRCSGGCGGEAIVIAARHPTNTGDYICNKCTGDKIKGLERLVKDFLIDSRESLERGIRYE